MGYTHRYAYRSADPSFRAAWPRMVTDARLIVERVRAAGIALPEDEDTPAVDDERILVGGGDTEELDGDPLAIYRDPGVLPPFMVDERGVVRGFCKTDRCPYDLAVCTILLRCRLLAPDAFFIGSDGDWDGEWANGSGEPGSSGLGARVLITELFGQTPIDSPFTD